MCLAHDRHAELRRCSHGTFHLRVGNTTLHLDQAQVLALKAELNRRVIERARPGAQAEPRFDRPAPRRYVN